MATTSMRMAFIKLKVRPRSRPRQMPLSLERKVVSAAGYAAPMRAHTQTLPALPLAWWQEYFRQLVAATLILFMLGVAVYFIAGSENSVELTAYKLMPLPESPAQRRSGSRYSQSELVTAGYAAVGSQANRKSPTDESFLASGHVRETAALDRPSRNLNQPPLSTDVRSVGNSGVRFVRGECLVALRPGEITAADIGDCLRNGPKD